MGITDRLSNAWYIFVTSLSFIKKDKSLLIIPLILIFTVMLFIIGFFILLFTPLLSAALIANLIIFIFLMYIWTTFLGAAQSWMVHEVAQGKDTTVLSGLKRAIKNIGDILLFALVKLIINLLASSLRKKGTLGHMAGNFLQYITGIAGKLVLPAMIITERNFMQSVKQLKEAIKTIPEIATFEIGIRPLTSLILLFSIGISVLSGLAFGLAAGIITIIILIIALNVFSILINQIYYTLLYLTLIEKKKIPGLKLSKI